MWTGEGWNRTQRQLGVFLLLILVVLDAAFHIRVFIGVYGIVASLLGLDVVLDALGSKWPGKRK